MSALSIRNALQTALAGISPALSTAWENQAFTPTTGTAYQIVHVLLAEPDNQTVGSEHQELGFMQIRLMYPPQVGPGDALTRAQLIRTTFYRGATFSSGGINVIISRTPEIMPGTVEDGRYQVVVKVRFYANIT